MLTEVSGIGVVGIVDCNDAPHIPWLFLEALPDPAVRLMSVTNLLISLCNAMVLLMKNHGSMLSNPMIVTPWRTEKNLTVSQVLTILKHVLSYQIRAIVI